MTMVSTERLFEMILDEEITLADELPRPYCDDGWHEDPAHTHRPISEPDPLGECCPLCLGSWWATDGSEPHIDTWGNYWLEIVARRHRLTMQHYEGVMTGGRMW